jgi:hypothetical protein
MLGAVPASAGPVVVGAFSGGDLSGWEGKKFSGETRYTLVEDQGRQVLKAEARQSASGLFKKVQVDPKAYPVLRWTWKVQQILEKGQAGTKAGDDYAARIYVIFPGTFFWQTRSINYIWANKLPRGESVPNAFARDNVMMLAVESGTERVGRWVEEERNIYNDYLMLFGEEPPMIGAIAVMTDADNTGGAATAFYGDIFLAAD